MPNGIGTSVRVPCSLRARTRTRTRAGADLVGLEDLARMSKAGEMNFDLVVSALDAMRVIGHWADPPVRAASANPRSAP